MVVLKEVKEKNEERQSYETENWKKQEETNVKRKWKMGTNP